MSHVLIAFLLAIGVAGFVYSKITRRTGGLTKNDLTIAGMAGVFAFVIVWSVLSIFAGK